MCGRFDRHRELSEFSKAIGALEVDDSAALSRNYNVAPSQRAYVVRAQGDRRVASALFWGLIPAWVRDKTLVRPINARSETVNDKPMFRPSVSGQRCLVLCDGYYEWQRTTNGRKRPYYFRLPDGEPMIFAGLWARNERLEGKVIETFCVITVPANVAAAVVHDRMPAILDRDGRSQWLDAKGVKRSELLSCLRPWPGEIEVLPVSTLVNNPANNSDRCIQALAADTKSI